MALLASGLTDIGQKRKSNQDAIYLDTEERYFIVADGMGGHNAGDICSKMAIELAPEYIRRHPTGDPSLLSREAIEFAHRHIRERAQADEKLAGMGTTFNGLLFRGSTLYLSNVGDSRCYLINQGSIYQLSRDHSLIQEKINLGLYCRKQAKADTQRSVITRTVGFSESVEVDVYSYKVSRYDMFLSCSDGLHGLVSDADILHIVNANIPKPERTNQVEMDKCIKALVDRANEAGGSDNISALIVTAV